MSEDDFDKLKGRISALELLAVMQELSDLRGYTREEIIEAAKRKAAFWTDIGKALEDDEAVTTDVARTQSFDRMGKLLVQFAGPIADHMFGLDNAGS